jgi:hypothetical protein
MTARVPTSVSFTAREVGTSRVGGRPHLRLSTASEAGRLATIHTIRANETVPFAELHVIG